MVARLRAWNSFKQQFTIVLIALILTVGFPMLTEIAGRDPESVPGVVILSEIGYYVLRGTPVVLVLLLIINLGSIKRRQGKINQKIKNDGITYLILPRPDADPVIANQVTLWHRIALALPYYKHISFEMSGGEDGVVFSLRSTNKDDARTILSKIIAEWPGTQMRIAMPEEDPLPTEAHFVEVRALKSDQPIVASTADPMKALLSEIALLPKGVRAGLQALVREDPFTRLKYSRKADDKTRKKPDPKMSPIIINTGQSKHHALTPSAEQRRHIRWLDERAQEAFMEVRLIIWASAGTESAKIAKNLAKTVAAQYHPNNKLITGWRIRRGNVQARTFPTFSGRPWVAGELGTIAHLVGRDGLFAAPALQVAPAKTLPAPPAIRITSDMRAMSYLLSEDEDLPQIIIEDDEDLPQIVIESDDDNLPQIIIESDEDLPTIIIERETNGNS